jgi:hypothetical protein
MTHGCTTWAPTVDNAGTFNLLCNVGGTAAGVRGVHGHVNWGPVAYEGRIRFEEFSGAWPYDGDLNFALFRPDQAGVTKANTYRDEQQLVGIDLEFDSAETIDFFDLKWWDDFQKAVDRSSAEADTLVHDHDAIAIGLLGLDHEHGGIAELHPLYGLAIHAGSTATEDVWQVFARNSGNEGMCSHKQHFFQQNSLSFFFRGTSGVADTSVFHANVPNGMSWNHRAVAGQGVVVTFNLPDPREKAVIHGELHLKRDANRPARTYPPLSPHHRNRHFLLGLHKEQEEGIEAWNRVLSRIGDDKKREAFLKKCAANKEDHRRRAKQRHWDVPLAGRVPAGSQRKLATAEPRMQTPVTTIAQMHEPIDHDLENRRLMFVQNLEDVIGDRKAFEQVVRGALGPAARKENDHPPEKPQHER